MKKSIIYICLSLGLASFTGCRDYLDVIPDNIATIEKAFTNRVSAEKFLFTCYSYMPQHTDPEKSPGFLAGDDMMTNYDDPLVPDYPNVIAARISLRQQNINNPLLNYWDGEQGVRSLFQGIRYCNMFIEEIHNARDMSQDEIAQWTAEVKSLKAYYHFYLLRLYGPIPVIKENMGLNTSPEKVSLFREPVSEVIDYICELIDEAVVDLPPDSYLPTEDLGRITKPIALAIKAQARLWDASPLFNGNKDYSNFIDKRGIHLVTQEYSAEKWAIARDAAKEAIEAAEAIGKSLFYYQVAPGYSFSDQTIAKLNIRGAFSQPWNNEIIWGDTHNTQYLQYHSQPRFSESDAFGPFMHHSGTLRMAQLFYSDKGIPIEEDPSYYPSSQWYGLQTATEVDKYNISVGYETVNLHFHREPRFYANLGFDGSTWYGNAKKDDNTLSVVKAKFLQPTGDVGRPNNVNATGYFPKKYLNFETVLSNTSWTQKRYSFPIIRLADLYLMYAEASNESQGPNAEVFKYLNPIRKRAGLNGVEASWANSTNPNKPQSKEGLREIIQQERLIELAFESSRFYDLRRWKLAKEYLSMPMQGWDISGKTSVDYYRVTTRRSNEFTTRDYLWPIKLDNLLTNSNLVQNPGWE